MSALDSVTGSFVPGDTSTPAVNYDYDSIVPSGVDLGSLGGIQSTSGGFDWGKVGNYLTGVLTGKGSPADYAGIAALVAGLSGMNKPAASPGWRGVIDPNKYTFTRLYFRFTLFSLCFPCFCRRPCSDILSSALHCSACELRGAG